jgi:hypothetical protein
LEDRPVLYPVSGQYNVEIVGADEVVLLTVPFDPVSVLLGDPEGAVDSGIGFFAMAVPEPDGDRDPMAQIRVVKEGTVLAQKDVTPNSPTVGVLWPNGGEELSVGTICTVTWQGADADGDPLYYAVLYSPDDEENWFTIAQEIQETQCTWETTGLCPGEAYRMRVIVTDGVNTTVDDSDGTFTILGTGDLDSDGDVDYYDFQVFVATWGRCLGDADYNPKADLDCDECITIVDYQMLLEYYRQFIGDPDAPPPGPPIQPVKGELVRPVEGPEARPNP